MDETRVSAPGEPGRNTRVQEVAECSDPRCLVGAAVVDLAKQLLVVREDDGWPRDVQHHAVVLPALSESDSSKEARKRSAKFQKRIDVAFGTILESAPKCGSEPRVAKVLEKIL